MNAYVPKRRGRRPKHLLEPGQMSYYHSVKQSIMNPAPTPSHLITETPNFHEFKQIVVETRENLVHCVKSMAARIGFKAIIPFSDRNNRQTATSYFCCSLSGVSSKRTSTNCPWKITYTKSIQDPMYRCQPDVTSYHNHPLPVIDMIDQMGRNSDQTTEQDRTA